MSVFLKEKYIVKFFVIITDLSLIMLVYFFFLNCN